MSCIYFGHRNGNGGISWNRSLHSEISSMSVLRIFHYSYFFGSKSERHSKVTTISCARNCASRFCRHAVSSTSTTQSSEPRNIHLSKYICKAKRRLARHVVLLALLRVKSLEFNASFAITDLTYYLMLPFYRIFTRS